MKTEIENLKKCREGCIGGFGGKGKKNDVTMLYTHKIKEISLRDIIGKQEDFFLIIYSKLTWAYYGMYL